MELTGGTLDGETSAERQSLPFAFGKAASVEGTHTNSSAKELAKASAPPRLVAQGELVRPSPIEGNT